LSGLSPTLLILALGAFGFAQYPLYGLCVGIANARLADQPPTQTASELLLIFGLGTIAGPLIAGQIMRSGANQLFTFIAALLALLVLALAADRLLAPRATSAPEPAAAGVSPP
jgi:predicted MFS family arabinose efflux permease